MTLRLDVAETLPLIACSGPLSEPMPRLVVVACWRIVLPKRVEEAICAPAKALKKPAIVVEPVESKLVVVAPPEKSAVTKCEVDDATIPSLAQMTEVVAEVVVP